MISADQRRLVKEAQAARDEARARVQQALELYNMLLHVAEEQSDRFVIKLETVVELAGHSPLQYQWDGENFVHLSDEETEHRTLAYYAVEDARTEALQKAKHTLFGAQPNP